MTTIEELKVVGVKQEGPYGLTICTEKRVFGGGRYRHYHVVQIFENNQEVYKKSSPNFNYSIELFNQLRNVKIENFLKSGKIPRSSQRNKGSNRG